MSTRDDRHTSVSRRSYFDYSTAYMGGGNAVGRGAMVQVEAAAIREMA